MIDIIFILDESLSMKDYIDSYIQGINSLIDTQKELHPNSNFTMIKFNTSVNVLCVDSKIHTLPKFTSDHYKPDGVTALYDAIGHGISLKKSNNSNNVIMIILTDGDDNNSSKYTINTISREIEYLKQCGWEFLYIAANQNSQIVGRKLGIETCLSYNESDKSISQIAFACSIAIGHAIQKWTGLPNQYVNQKMPTDISDLMNELDNIKI